MKKPAIKWYIINTGYEDRLCTKEADNDYGETYMNFTEQCQLIKELELDFEPGEYMISTNRNDYVLQLKVYYNDDDKKYEFKSINKSDLSSELAEYIQYKNNIGMVLSTIIPTKLPYCDTFGIIKTTLYQTKCGHYLLKLSYNSESG